MQTQTRRPENTYLRTWRTLVFRTSSKTFIYEPTVHSIHDSLDLLVKANRVKKKGRISLETLPHPPPPTPKQKREGERDRDRDRETERERERKQHNTDRHRTKHTFIIPSNYRDE